MRGLQHYCKKGKGHKKDLLNTLNIKKRREKEIVVLVGGSTTDNLLIEFVRCQPFVRRRARERKTIRSKFLEWKLHFFLCLCSNWDQKKKKTPTFYILFFFIKTKKFSSCKSKNLFQTKKVWGQNWPFFFLGFQTKRFY